MTSVAPSRVRELKQVLWYPDIDHAVAPSRVRELKQQQVELFRSAGVVAPSRVRELKPRFPS